MLGIHRRAIRDCWYSAIEMLQILWLLLVPVVFAADHNHDLHNFGSGLPAATHAREMGYRFLVARTADSPRPDGVGAIALHNANVGPVRVYVRKSDGKLFVGYHAFLKRRQDNLNPVALQHGLGGCGVAGRLLPLTNCTGRTSRECLAPRARHCRK